MRPVGSTSLHSRRRATQPRRRATARAVLAAGILAILTGCSLVPLNGADDLVQIGTVRLLSIPPPGGIVVAKGVDRGTIALESARDPGLARVFAARLTTDALAAYYQVTYPQYHLHRDPGATPTSISLVGRSSPAWIVIGIDIRSGMPHLIPHYGLTPPSSLTGFGTFVTVNVTGKSR
ncbi:MAG: hypothetical protein QOE16_1898 [Microbacteriaceae bacterium]|nr:hypothetical protein [Microbacteriaceae bacterium]